MENNHQRYGYGRRFEVCVFHIQFNRELSIVKKNLSAYRFSHAFTHRPIFDYLKEEFFNL